MTYLSAQNRRSFDPLLLVNAAHPLSQGPLPDLVPVDDAHPDILLERRAAVRDCSRTAFPCPSTAIFT